MLRVCFQLSDNRFSGRRGNLLDMRPKENIGREEMGKKKINRSVEKEEEKGENKQKVWRKRKRKGKINRKWR